MIRRTVISVVDQALLSATNFAFGITLIRFATKEEYGLYSQLINLQPLLSPFHAGVFVNAYLAIASRMSDPRRSQYRSGMARVEIAFTLLSSVIAAVGMFAVARLLGLALPWTTSVAAAAALLGLWWREFARARNYVDLQPERVLRLDAGYALGVICATAIGAWKGITSAEYALGCAGLAAILVASGPVLAAARSGITDLVTMKADLAQSWRTGRWDVFSSFLTWGYAQTYVYFAAIQGGLVGAAEISAGRLLAMPLALLWASYGNVLVPSAARLFSEGSPGAVRTLARRSVLLVVGCSVAYGVVLVLLLPLAQRLLFGDRFPHIRTLAVLWVVYFSCTGVNTIAACLLRSALEFQQIFVRYVLSCTVAIALLATSLLFDSVCAPIVALTAVELVLMGLFWSRIARILARQHTQSAAIIGEH